MGSAKALFLLLENLQGMLQPDWLLQLLMVESD